MMKMFPIHERLTLQFRAEAFNVLNQVVFAAPNTTVGSASFGVIGGQGNTPAECTARLEAVVVSFPLATVKDLFFAAFLRYEVRSPLNGDQRQLKQLPPRSGAHPATQRPAGQLGVRQPRSSRHGLNEL